MTQKSLHWDGASVGDAQALTVSAPDGIGYRLRNADYESPFVDLVLRMLFNGDENRGVLRGWGNELEVTGAATPVQVDTGGAIVYGMPYENTAAVNVAVPSPTTDVRHDRIVLRCDWAAQTIRITRLAGIEGGGVPALVQSPAPAGSGVYDVPLAGLEVSTAGVITITDEREFCTYGTGIGTGSLDTAQLADDSIAFADRETRERILFIGAGEMEAALSAGRFSAADIIMTGAAGWGGAGGLDGWQLSGSRYEGAYCTFWLPPPDWATGDVTAYVWFVNNAVVTASFTVYTAAQMRSAVGNPWGIDYYAGPTGTAVTSTGAVGAVWRTAGLSLPAQYFCDPYESHTIHLLAYWDNAAGAEDISLLGVELRYTGYV